MGTGSLYILCEDFGYFQEGAEAISFPKGMLIADLSQVIYKSRCPGNSLYSYCNDVKEINKKIAITLPKR